MLCDKMQLTFPDGRADLIGVPLIARWADARGPVDPNLADSIDTALVVIHARVLALLLDTSQGPTTVAVHVTFRFTFRVGVSLKTSGAGTLAVVADRSSDGIAAARVGLTRVNNIRNGGWRSNTFNQRVASESREAGTDRRMSSDFTDRVSTTDARTGVVAVEVPAGHVGGTVRVDDALRLALHVGIALVVRWTSAFTVITNAPCDSSSPTGVGHTRICYHGLS